MSDFNQMVPDQGSQQGQPPQHALPTHHGQHAYYGPPAHYGPPLHEQKNSLGIWALVLGIASIMMCAMVAGIPAIIVGRAAEKAHEQGLANNKPLARAGWILGIIGTVVWTLVGLLIFLSVLLPVILAAVVVGTAEGVATY